MGTIRKPRKGFFTDTSICIGCKACEVACKEWNRNPRDGDLELLGSSYDNTGALGASTWRHVAFIEQGRDRIEEARESGRALIDLGMPARPRHCAGRADSRAAGHPGVPLADVVRRVQALHARRLPRRLPDGCVVPHRVRHRRRAGRRLQRVRHLRGRLPVRRGRASQRRHVCHAGASGQVVRPNKPVTGVAQKCTLCYDRLVEDQIPACAKTCPTTSIKFGDHDDLVATARERVAELHAQGLTEARLYGANEHDGVGGTGSIFLLLDEPEVYGLPPDPRVPTADLVQMFKRAGLAAAGMVAAAALAFWRAR